jgi:carbonic anhydrase
MRGNQRFLSGQMKKRDFSIQVNGTESGQYPYAIVLGCMDSRATPELVFDQGIGDIFDLRIAGNFVTPDILGSMEYGTKVAGAKVIVVMGHSSCGAVKGACDGVELGNLTQTLANVSPAVYATPGHEGKRTSKNHDFVEEVSAENVHLQVQNITQRSAILKELVDSGKLVIVGAMYDIHSGKVAFYEDSRVPAAPLPKVAPMTSTTGEKSSHSAPSKGNPKEEGHDAGHDDHGGGHH